MRNHFSRNYAFSCLKWYLASAIRGEFPVGWKKSGLRSNRDLPSRGWNVGINRLVLIGLIERVPQEVV